MRLPSGELLEAGDLTFADPRIEAKTNLKIASTNGGIEKMRALVAVSKEEKRELQHMHAAGVLSRFLVLKSLHYCADLLREFDKLVDMARRDHLSDSNVVLRKK